jgi:hypothetical protein
MAWIFCSMGILFCVSGVYFFFKNIYEENKGMLAAVLLMVGGLCLIGIGTAKYLDVIK